MIKNFLKKMNNFFTVKEDLPPQDGQKYKKVYQLTTLGSGRGGFPVLYSVWKKDDNTS